MREESKMVKPLGSHVLVKNPFYKAEEKFAEVEKLPQAQRQAYLEEKIGNLWEQIQVISTGPEVRSVHAGDTVVLNAQQAQASGISVQGGEYTLIRESVIVAKW